MGLETAEYLCRRYELDLEELTDIGDPGGFIRHHEQSWAGRYTGEKEKWVAKRSIS